MDKFEKKFFNTLVSKSGFYIRSFYSESLKKGQWIAILENEKVLYAIVIVENSYNVSLYDEAYRYLKSFSNKNFVINEIVTTDILVRISAVLECDLADIMELQPVRE